MKRTWLFAVVTLTPASLPTPAVAQLRTPAGYKEKMRDLYQNPPEAVWVSKPAPGALPVGVTHHTYRSKSMGHDIGYSIYLPPAYQKEPQRRFPVIYHLHGASGDELLRLRNAEVLHEGIVAGKWPPIIMVFPSGGKRTFYKDWQGGKFMSETTLIEELIPLVDESYRTVAARRGRCIEGFSMGGRGSTRLAMKYPEMFCSVFNQAGNVIRIAELFDPSRPDEFPNSVYGNDRARYVENDAFELLKKNRERIRGGMRIQIMCGTADKTHLPTVREFHQALLDAGVDHTYIEAEGIDHDQYKLIDQYKPVWFDYHVESLRRAGEKAKQK